MIGFSLKFINTHTLHTKNKNSLKALFVDNGSNQGRIINSVAVSCITKCMANRYEHLGGELKL